MPTISLSILILYKNTRNTEQTKVLLLSLASNIQCRSLSLANLLLQEGSIGNIIKALKCLACAKYSKRPIRIFPAFQLVLLFIVLEQNINPPWYQKMVIIWIICKFVFAKVDFQWLKLSSKLIQNQCIILKSIDWSTLRSIYIHIYVLLLNGLYSRR